MVELAAPSAARGSQDLFLGLLSSTLGKSTELGKRPSKGLGHVSWGPEKSECGAESSQMGVSIEVSGHQAVWAGDWEPKTQAV